MRASTVPSNTRSHKEGSARMLEFLRNGRYPEDPRELLEQIAAKYPDREKCRRIFVAAVLDDQRYLRAAIECAFETWTSRAPQ
jgi:hypothetical protein